jgi:hypothetical protein
MHDFSNTPTPYLIANIELAPKVGGRGYPLKKT